MWQVSTVPLLRRHGVERERLIDRVCHERRDRVDRAVKPIGKPDVNPIASRVACATARPPIAAARLQQSTAFEPVTAFDAGWSDAGRFDTDP